MGETPSRRAVSVREEDFEPGTVKFVHADGYGFIQRDGLPDVYFHVAHLVEDVASTIKQDMAVEVAVGDGKRGPHAIAVRMPA